VATVCVFCASSDRIPQRYVDLATEVGTALSRRGHSIVSGGGSVSCMGAVARAARAGGARTIGVIPRALLEAEVADHDADELVVTETMRERKAEMERRADAFLTLPGGIGTLEELFEIWVARTLGMHDKPLVVLDPDDAFAPLRDQVAQLVERGFARASILEAIDWVTGVDEAIDRLETPAAHRAPEPDEMLEAEP